VVPFAIRIGIVHSFERYASKGERQVKKETNIGESESPSRLQLRVIAFNERLLNVVYFSDSTEPKLSSTYLVFC
jgi:hypothetical protein